VVEKSTTAVRRPKPSGHPGHPYRSSVTTAAGRIAHNFRVTLQSGLLPKGPRFEISEPMGVIGAMNGRSRPSRRSYGN